MSCPFRRRLESRCEETAPRRLSCFLLAIPGRAARGAESVVLANGGEIVEEIRGGRRGGPIGIAANFPHNLGCGLICFTQLGIRPLCQFEMALADILGQTD